MGTNVTNEGGISRRSFLGGVAGVGALAAMGLAGCSPKAAGTTGAESASSSASAATCSRKNSRGAGIWSTSYIDRPLGTASEFRRRPPGNVA